MGRSAPRVFRLRLARAPSVPAFSSLVPGRPHGASLPRGRCGTSMFRTLTGLIGTRDGPPRVALRESPPEHPCAFLKGPADPGNYADIYLSNHWIHLAPNRVSVRADARAASFARAWPARGPRFARSPRPSGRARSCPLRGSFQKGRHYLPVRPGCGLR